MNYKPFPLFAFSGHFSMERLRAAFGAAAGVLVGKPLCLEQTYVREPVEADGSFARWEERWEAERTVWWEREVQEPTEWGTPRDPTGFESAFTLEVSLHFSSMRNVPMVVRLEARQLSLGRGGVGGLGVWGPWPSLDLWDRMHEAFRSALSDARHFKDKTHSASAVPVRIIEAALEYADFEAAATLIERADQHPETGDWCRGELPRLREELAAARRHWDS